VPSDIAIETQVSNLQTKIDEMRIHHAQEIENLQAHIDQDNQTIKDLQAQIDQMITKNDKKNK
jgi:peptidoglycan hydrolase CwlO-like protein